MEEIVGTKGRDRGVIGGLRSDTDGGVFDLAGCEYISAAGSWLRTCCTRSCGRAITLDDATWVIFTGVNILIASARALRPIAALLGKTSICGANGLRSTAAAASTSICRRVIASNAVFRSSLVMASLAVRYLNASGSNACRARPSFTRVSNLFQCNVVSDRWCVTPT